MTDYTEQEVRDMAQTMAMTGFSEHRSRNDRVSKMLTQLADMLAEREKAEPVRQFRVAPKGSVWTDVKDPEIWASVTAHPESYETRILYNGPQPAQDAKDAARYRWLRSCGAAAEELAICTDYGWVAGSDFDETVDAAMAKESGR